MPDNIGKRNKKMNYKTDIIKEVAGKIKESGNRVFISSNGEYGFFTDPEGLRVVTFGIDLGTVYYSGNYNSTNSGTGWKLDNQKAGFSEMLSADAPRWAIGKDPKWSYKTMEQHLAIYQSSSQYKEVE
jgi:hypothetical protein